MYGMEVAALSNQVVDQVPFRRIGGRVGLEKRFSRRRDVGDVLFVCIYKICCRQSWWLCDGKYYFPNGLVRRWQ